MSATTVQTSIFSIRFTCRSGHYSCQRNCSTSVWRNRPLARIVLVQCDDPYIVFHQDKGQTLQVSDCLERRKRLHCPLCPVSIKFQTSVTASSLRQERRRGQSLFMFRPRERSANKLVVLYATLNKLDLAP